MKRFNLVCFSLIAFSLVDKDKVIRNPPTGLIKIIQKDNFPEGPHKYWYCWQNTQPDQISWWFSLFNLKNIDLCSVPCPVQVQFSDMWGGTYHRRVKSEPTNKSYLFRNCSSIGQTNNQGITHSRTWILRFAIKKTAAVTIMITMMVMLMKKMEIHSFNYLFW